MNKTGIIFLVVLSSVGCDQLTKNIARDNLAASEPLRFLHGTLLLQYTENPGIFLSFGAHWPEHARRFLFIFFIALLLLCLLLYLIRSRTIPGPALFALSLVLGGGIGNLIDRIVNHGRVIDFMNLGLGNIRTGIFNMADATIVLGCVLFFLLSIPAWNRLKK